MIVRSPRRGAWEDALTVWLYRHPCCCCQSPNHFLRRRHSASSDLPSSNMASSVAAVTTSPCSARRAAPAPARRNRNNARAIQTHASAAAPSSQSAVSAVSWPDGSGCSENGDVAATATAVNLGKRGNIATGLPFLDHMIDQLTSHCQLGVSVVVTKNGVECKPCEDASGADDVAVASAAGAALGAALKVLLAPGVAAVKSGGEGAARSGKATFAAPLDEAYCTCTLDVAVGPRSWNPSTS